MGRRTWEYFHRLIDFCGDLGGSIMVYGSPKGRSTEGKISIAEATRNLAEGLARVADHAQERGLKVLLEPLGRNQTDVVNTMAEAMKILKEINHPAIETIFDFHNTADETEPFHRIIEKYFPYISHVHVQEMDGKYLGSGNAVNDYVRAFQTLKDLHYEKWVSLEVFDFSPGPLAVANESIETLREIEKKCVGEGWESRDG